MPTRKGNKSAAALDAHALRGSHAFCESELYRQKPVRHSQKFVTGTEVWWVDASGAVTALVVRKSLATPKGKKVLLATKVAGGANYVPSPPQLVIDNALQSLDEADYASFSFIHMTALPADVVFFSPCNPMVMTIAEVKWCIRVATFEGLPDEYKVGLFCTYHPVLYRAIRHQAWSAFWLNTKKHTLFKR